MGRKQGGGGCDVFAVVRDFDHCGSRRLKSFNCFVAIIALILIYAFIFAIGSYVRGNYVMNSGGYWGAAILGFFIFLILLVILGWLLFPRGCF